MFGASTCVPRVWRERVADERSRAFARAVGSHLEKCSGRMEAREVARVQGVVEEGTWFNELVACLRSRGCTEGAGYLATAVGCQEREFVLLATDVGRLS